MVSLMMNVETIQFLLISAFLSFNTQVLVLNQCFAVHWLWSLCYGYSQEANA